jgi:hypothetical protein
MFNYYGKDTRTDQERYLADELERERAASRERDRLEEERRQARQSEFSEAQRYEERQADSWPEAFQKQARLCWREQNRFPDPDDDPFFKKNAQANEKALELWRAVATSKRDRLDELQRQIDAVWDEVRNEVADQLIQADEHFVYKSTAEAIRDDQLSGYLDW